MSTISELFGLSKSKEYEDAVARRQQTGRMTTGGTGYSDKQTRGLQFAQDVARGWTAQALGESMGQGQGLGTRAVNASLSAQNATNQNNQYEALNSLDEAKRRAEGLQVAEANEQEKEKSDRFYDALQTGINTAGTLINGVSMARGGTAGAEAGTDSNTAATDTKTDTKTETTAQTSK